MCLPVFVCVVTTHTQHMHSIVCVVSICMYVCMRMCMLCLGVQSVFVCMYVLRVSSCVCLQWLRFHVLLVCISCLLATIFILCIYSVFNITLIRT